MLISKCCNSIAKSSRGVKTVYTCLKCKKKITGNNIVIFKESFTDIIKSLFDIKYFRDDRILMYRIKHKKPPILNCLQCGNVCSIKIKSNAKNEDFYTCNNISCPNYLIICINGNNFNFLNKKK